MAKARSKIYVNDSISTLKGADRVRKRPGVIFGSDGLEGCEHSVFEILSNSIDEAREGFGDRIIITRFADHSIQVEDFGRGVPVDYNPTEKRFNWELVFCELYAGGKYNTREGESYEFSLGLNGLGACATQYSARYMDVVSKRDGMEYRLHFERGENVGGLEKQKIKDKKTGTLQHWLPDLDVFTEIEIPLAFFQDMLKRQAVVNPGIHFELRDETAEGFETYPFFYENGIEDYVKELAGENALTPIQHWSCERIGRDRKDKPDYKVKIDIAFCFHNSAQRAEYYHN
ncbi:MAG TPA: DNA topoisomerase, partial [Ruminococcaceae bacterium]|nr:DNA topoisomerase [Oscillospiraceae bacterium]